MTIEQLQLAIHAEPFQPFTLLLADGRQLHVPHPDFISHPPKARTVVVWREDQTASQIVDLLLVVSLDFAVPASGTPGSPP
jgi:hypothetical protein